VWISWWIVGGIPVERLWMNGGNHIFLGYKRAISRCFRPEDPGFVPGFFALHGNCPANQKAILPNASEQLKNAGQRSRSLRGQSLRFADVLRPFFSKFLKKIIFWRARYLDRKT